MRSGSGLGSAATPQDNYARRAKANYTPTYEAATEALHKTAIPSISGDE